MIGPEFTLGAIEDLKNSDDELFQQFSNDLKNILKEKFEFKDFKISSIITTANPQADNPSHNYKINSQNFLVKGSIGTGKTTFFDKILHPFYNWEKEKSPIQDYVTDIKIEFDNDREKIELKYNSSGKTSKILLGEYNQKDSINLLKKYGFLEKSIVLLFFISETADFPDLFRNKIDNFLRFKEFFYNPVQFNILNYLREQISIFKNRLIGNRMELLSFKNALVDIQQEIKELKEDIYDIKQFIENFEIIKEKLSSIKSNEELLKLNAKEKEIEREIAGLKQRRRKRQNYLDGIDSKKGYRENLDFIINLHINSANICPVCSSFITFDDFKKSYNKKLCYLCKSERFEYPKFQQPKAESESPGLLNDSILLHNREKQLEIVKKEKVKLKANVLQKDSEVIKIMSKFYLDLNRPNFSLNEELIRKKRQLNNFKVILRDKTNRKTNYLQIRQNQLEKNIEIIQKILNQIQELFKKTKKSVDNENSRIFEQFKEDIRYFWDKLSSDDIKSIVVQDNELTAVTFSKKEYPKKIKITSLSKMTQRGLSMSQLNVVRYAIHLSLIKNLVKKYEKVPIRTIIIDDPENKIIDSLVKVLEEDFSKALNFQYILFTTDKPDGFNGQIIEFKRYENDIKKNESKYKTLLDYLTNPPKKDSGL